MGSCCGGAKAVTDYEITFRDGSPNRTVTAEEGGLVTVRQLLARSAKGGTFKAVPRKTS